MRNKCIDVWMGYTKIEIDASYVPRAGDVIVQRNNGTTWVITSIDGQFEYCIDRQYSHAVKNFAYVWPSDFYLIRRPIPAPPVYALKDPTI